MSDKVKVSAPWGQQGGKDSSSDGECLGDTANLLQVPCPDCGQALALGREYLGGHCLCSVCDVLMSVSLQKVDGRGMVVVAEKVDKVTGKKVAGSLPVSAHEAGGESMDEDWANTRPVKMWTGALAFDAEQEAEDDMDLGVTMPIPTVVKLGGRGKPNMARSRGLGAAMPVPTIDKAADEGGADDDWEMTSPSRSLPTAPTTGKQGVKLAPSSVQAGNVSVKSLSPTSGAVPTTTTPPTKAPSPTSGSVPTLDAEQVEARPTPEIVEQISWQPPGATSPIGQSAGAKAQKAETAKEAKKKKAANEKKKGDPFGNKQSGGKKKKVKVARGTKSHKGLVFVMLMFLLVCAGVAVFFIAPGLFPGGLEAKEFVDGKIDEIKGKVEGRLAQRATNGGGSPDPLGGAVVNLTPNGVKFSAPKKDAASGTADEGVGVTPMHTRESDAALQKLLSQEGKRVIRNFYGASTIGEKSAFVVDSEAAMLDMEEYFSEENAMPTIRSVMFRGGARDSETGYYYGVFDVVENENDGIHRWCVVDPGTGLYQVDWILYRQIAASKLGAFLRTPTEEEGAQSFYMLMKMGAAISADDSPWFDDAVRVELQVPMISSAWYPVLMKRPLAESRGLTTKLANNRLTMAVVEIAWVPGDKNPSKRYPAIIGIKRWGAWARSNNF